MTASHDTPETGIFALGTSSHVYLELDLLVDAGPRELVTRLADLREPRTTIGGVNLVVGLRPELWPDDLRAAAPAELHGFDRPIIGPDGLAMPATQHDALLWLAGAAYDVVFDEAREAIAALAPVARVATETSSWPYRHDRDLTGSSTAPRTRVLPAPLMSRSYHRTRRARAERCCCCNAGRTRQRRGRPSPSLPKKPPWAVPKTAPPSSATSLRRRAAAAGADARQQGRAQRWPARRADPLHDPQTGSYYFVPSLTALRQFANDDVSPGFG